MKKKLRKIIEVGDEGLTAKQKKRARGWEEFLKQQRQINWHCEVCKMFGVNMVSIQWKYLTKEQKQILKKQGWNPRTFNKVMDLWELLISEKEIRKYGPKDK